MLGTVLRIALIVSSLLTAGFMLRHIRSAKVQIKDSVFWIIFSFFILLLSLFPNIAGWASNLLGIASPINFVFLFIIFVLLVHQFYASVRISQMETKMKLLAQQIALDEKDRQDKES
ncbi:DUF2304 domain-containing protein [Ruminococcaceae bacterium OttesenSCG-928-A16]|nr:DUF2304 domain-containing protein [Ruminococcaceae bacterium OttesenSCG-928-A16]